MSSNTNISIKVPASGDKDEVKASTEAKVNTRLTPTQKIELYTQMLRIRRFEERAIHSYQQGKIGGFCHVYIGQESVAVGSISVLGKDDHLITAYRDHGHALAVGMSMDECMAELYGKHTGCSKGKGGSMHLFAPDKRYWGGHGIVGAQTPLAAGIAFALKYQGKHGCCLCYLGDGAVNQGVLYESLNLASLWDLPLVYIIENNGYSMGTSQARSSSGFPLAKRAEGYDIDWEVCRGNLLYEVRAKTWEAVRRAREKSRPTLLEMLTYRYRGHSMSDPDKTYRSKEEIEEYKRNKDPITLFQNILIEEGTLSEAQIKAIDKETRKETAHSATFAEESPYPAPEEITANVYWEEDHPDHKKAKGTIFFN